MVLLVTTLTILVLLSLLGSLSLLIYLVKTERKAPHFSKSVTELGGRHRASLVSIIIPARNEEETIGECINSLVLQSCKNVEILVIDDCSSDGTANIVKRLAVADKRIKLVEAGNKPQGWVGKSWPCWVGFENSNGEYLLFVDADSRLAPKTLEASLNYVIEKNIEMFSLAPRVEMPSFVARAVMPIISGAINLLYPMQKVNDPKSKRAYVFGTFILVSRSTYATMEGHKRVRAEIVEDGAIAREAKTHGHSLRIERGPEFISTRWESKASDIYNGLERIMSSSVRNYGLLATIDAAIVFFVSLYPILFIIYYIAARPFGLTSELGLVAALLGSFSFVALAAHETGGISGKITAAGLLYPVGCTFFIAAIITTSIKVSRNRKIKWKETGYLQTMATRPSTNRVKE